MLGRVIAGLRPEKTAVRRRAPAFADELAHDPGGGASARARSGGEQGGCCKGCGTDGFLLPAPRPDRGLSLVDCKAETYAVPVFDFNAISPVSSRDLRLERMRGQPPDTA